MEEKTVNSEQISNYLFEAIQARNERTVKRLWIALVVAIVAIFITNAIWLYAWTSYDYVTTETTYTQDGEGNNVIGDNNSVYDQANPAWSNLDNKTPYQNQEEWQEQGD